MSEHRTRFGDEEVGRAVARALGVDLRERSDDPGPFARIDGSVAVVEHLRGHAGNIHAGALLAIADTVAGMCGGLAALPRWVVSTNLMVQCAAVVAEGPLDVQAHTLRTGRNAAVTEVQIVDVPTRNVLTDGVLTSAILTPEAGPPPFARPLELRAPEINGSGPLPIREFFGIRERDATSVGLDITAEVRNPWGILHGGVSAALIDAAAEHAATVRGGVTTDAVLHFLAPGRVGPVVASTESLGVRPDGEVVRVTVTDEGAGDRLLAIAIATVRVPA
jgi:uncharacterized protein (TIGR00369 family)